MRFDPANGPIRAERRSPSIADCVRDRVRRGICVLAGWIAGMLPFVSIGCFKTASEAERVATNTIDSETVSESEMDRPLEQTESRIIVTNRLGMTFVQIPAGDFLMGDDDSRMNPMSDRYPQPKVTISKSLFVQTTEVTQEQWHKVMETTPWNGKDHAPSDREAPASYVNQIDALEFCQRLIHIDGNSYRLPTEAEWEYACRAGTTGRYSFGDDPAKIDEFAWVRENSWDRGERYPHRVALKRPNPWGLHDMHGNVAEWCADRYEFHYYSTAPRRDPVPYPTPSEGGDQVCRGGSFAEHANASTCFERIGVENRRSALVGFRVVYE